MLRMTDEGEIDDKILAAPAHDPRWDELQNLDGVASHRLAELHHFFTHYKDLEEKETRVAEWVDRLGACDEITDSLSRYHECHG
jgi:inorganic pyrophosphatase